MMIKHNSLEWWSEITRGNVNNKAKWESHVTIRSKVSSLFLLPMPFFLVSILSCVLRETNDAEGEDYTTMFTKNRTFSRLQFTFASITANEDSLTFGFANLQLLSTPLNLLFHKHDLNQKKKQEKDKNSLHSAVSYLSCYLPRPSVIFILADEKTECLHTGTQLVCFSRWWYCKFAHHQRPFFFLFFISILPYDPRPSVTLIPRSLRSHERIFARQL